MEAVGLALHPDKTRIVYCQDGKRRGSYEHTAFTFLGYTFRARGARRKDGARFTAFMPAISKDALKKISAEVRSWRLDHRTGHTDADLARKINPIVRGWMNYYGAFYRSALYSPPGTHQRLPAAVGPQQVPAAASTQESPGRVERRSPSGIPGSSRTGPGLTGIPPSGDQDDKSRINREVHVRICESPGVRFPRRLDKTRTAGGTSSTPASISSATPSGAAWPRAAEAISLASPRPSAARRRRRKASRSGTGTSTAAAARTCPAWPGRSIPRSRAGSTITEPSTAPSCASWHGASTSTSSGGPCTSSSDSAASTPKRWPGCRRCISTSLACSPTGSSSRSPKAGLWGPDDGRPSRPVLRAAGGETPPADSPGSFIQALPKRCYQYRANMRSSLGP